MIGALLRQSFPFFLSTPFSTAQTKPGIHHLLLPFRTKHLNGFSFNKSFYHRPYSSLQSQSVHSNSNSCDAFETPSSSSPRLDFLLFNTMTKQKEVFKPKDPGKVGMYVCGSPPTTSASSATLASTSPSMSSTGRCLKHVGYEVCYVRNFTDVDDKIITHANQLEEDPIKLSSRYCEEFLSNMAYLHCLPPFVEPRVTDRICQIIDMIKQGKKQERRMESLRALKRRSAMLSPFWV